MPTIDDMRMGDVTNLLNLDDYTDRLIINADEVTRADQIEAFGYRVNVTSNEAGVKDGWRQITATLSEYNQEAMLRLDCHRSSRLEVWRFRQDEYAIDRAAAVAALSNPLGSEDWRTMTEARREQWRIAERDQRSISRHYPNWPPRRGLTPMPEPEPQQESR